jgi:murein DD-endopeptidase MepM/ murein hydrolase activator NlpD
MLSRRELLAVASRMGTACGTCRSALAARSSWKQDAVAATSRDLVRIAVPILASTLVVASAPPAPTIALSSSTARPGDVVVLTLSGVNADEAVHVRAFDSDLPTFVATRGTRRALVGVDLDVRPGTHTLAVQVGDNYAERTLRIIARAFATRRLTVDPAFVNPPENERPRIEREREQLERLWKTATNEKLWGGRFEPPVPERANSAFGTRSILNGEPRSPHGGADFPSPAGTPIKAPNGGRVVLADALYYTGNTVVVDHGLGLYSLFAHMTEMRVHAEDVVNTGDALGTVGSTGRVTGPHLHWAVRLNGARVDPTVLLRVVQ